MGQALSQWSGMLNVAQEPSALLHRCLFTIFICTWTSQHPNIPELSQRQNPYTRVGILNRIRRICSLFQWYLVGVIAPEFWVGRAIADRVAALNSSEDFKGEKEWTLTHSFFANMGGFVVQGELDQQTRPDFVDGAAKTGYEDDSSRGPLFDLKRRTAAKKNAQTAVIVESASQTTEYYILNAKQVRFMVSQHAFKLSDLPLVEEILDKSKSDVYVKSLAVLHITYLGFNILYLISTAQSVTALEYLALGYALCATITYMAWLSKPQRAGVPFTIKLSSSSYSIRTESLVQLSERSFLSERKRLDLRQPITNDADFELRGNQQFQGSCFGWKLFSLTWIDMGLIVGGSCLSCLHFLCSSAQFVMVDGRPSWLQDDSLWMGATFSSMGFLLLPVAGSIFNAIMINRPSFESVGYYAPGSGGLVANRLVNVISVLLLVAGRLTLLLIALRSALYT